MIKNMFILLFIIASSFLLLGCNGDVLTSSAVVEEISTSPKLKIIDSSDSEVVDSTELRIVDSRYICMINNKYFNEPQIQVAVDGKLYYGCCDRCKNMLSENEDSRFALDPVSENKVDKSLAVIGVDDNNNVYYFENEENLKSFS